MDEHRCYHEGDIAELKANMKAAFNRIDELRGIYDVLSKQSENIHSLALNITKLTERMDSTNIDIKAIQSDVEAIKRIPSEDYRHYKRQWIGGVVMLIIGALIGAILQGVSL